MNPWKKIMFIAVQVVLKIIVLIMPHPHVQMLDVPLQACVFVREASLATHIFPMDVKVLLPLLLVPLSHSFFNFLIHWYLE